MRTDDLIAALAADQQPPSQPPGRSFMAAVIIGLTVSLAPFALLLGPRADLADSLATWRFDAKLAVTALALVVALIDCIRLARPQSRGLTTRWALLVPTILAIAVAAELSSIPANAWLSRLVGSNALVCLAAIPALALAPLAAGLLAMRNGAPTAFVSAGAAVGRLAAAAAALLYALHCVDDSPLFVATWYTLASAMVIALGAALGPRALRW